MSQLHRLILHPLTGKIFLGLLAIVYALYLVALGRFLYTSVLAPSGTVIEHPVETNPDVDPNQAALFAFRVWNFKQGEMVSLLIHLGDRLGLYRALDGAGAVTADAACAALSSAGGGADSTSHGPVSARASYQEPAALM